ncbi:uncharacterized protein [Dermacentor albipictus]|uniref:uncharacterized protein isoform X1 n=1 Tax=Dermacentor albipictus TaxID=60249 RepID=UPI0038FCD44E
MALQQGFRAAKNFKRLACRISPLRPKSSIPADWSGGAGKGGGAGGSIREAGGGFAKIQVAREEQYFRKLVSGPPFAVVAQPKAPPYTFSPTSKRPRSRSFTTTSRGTSRSASRSSRSCRVRLTRTRRFLKT